MSGGFLRSGGRRAHGLVLRHLRPFPFCGELSKPSSAPVRAYNRSHLLSSKFKQPSSGHSPASPSLYSPSLSPATAAASSSSSIRNGFVGWYLGMIEARPILTKSLTAGAIFTAADISSQVCLLRPCVSLLLFLD
ncbi:hypothetical protein BHE74_00054624 [Ensete ventricosum]|nr:hypothetical protein BHE74_00054624 [Ensete ventricosum]